MDEEEIKKTERKVARRKSGLAESHESKLKQTCHRRKDGSIFPLEISIAFLPENGGQMLCFCRDITERKLGRGGTG
jgi:PAS domain S-box-containing protein